MRQTKSGLLRVTEAEIPHIVGLSGPEWCFFFPLAPSGNGEFSAAVPSRAVASTDLGVQAVEVEVPSGGLSPETGHVEDSRSAMFSEIGFNLKDHLEIVTRGIRFSLGPWCYGRVNYPPDLSRRQGVYCEESSEAWGPRPNDRGR